MLDPMDYKEPKCACEGGEEFYNPNPDQPKGNLPVQRIIERLDGFFNKNDIEGAGDFLRRWETEAKELNDKRGELTIQSELIGYYRKTGDKERGLKAIERGLELVDILDLKDAVSGATVMLNAGTTYKAFGYPEKAEPLYEKTLQIYDKHLDKADARFGGFYNNYALTLAELKKYDRAIEYYNNALSVMKNVKGGAPDMAITKINLANLYEELNDEKMVNAMMDDAYALLKGNDVVKNGYYASVLDKCAPAFGYYGYFLIEAELKKEAEDIYANS